MAPSAFRRRAAAAKRCSRIAVAYALLGAAGCSDCRRPPDRTPAEPVEKVVRIIHGRATWYGADWQGKRTASGEPFDRHALTGAHRSLPLGTRARVTEIDSGRQVIVRITDRGPYGRDRRRILDLSEAAARELGFIERGWTHVKIEVLAPQPGASPPAR